MRAMRHAAWALLGVLLACGDSASPSDAAVSGPGGGGAGGTMGGPMLDARVPIVTPPDADTIQGTDAGTDAATMDAATDEADASKPDAGDAGQTGDAGDATTTSPLGVPESIGGTGLYADDSLTAISRDARAYEPATFLWSDSATKRRWLYLPPGSQIDTSDMDNWKFPEGTKAFKEFTRGGVRVETRMLEKTDTGWLMMAYAWKADQSDALAVPNGAPNVLMTDHDIPSAGQCRDCHDAALDVLLGVSAIQLSHDRGTLNYQQLDAAGLLSDAPIGRTDYRPPPTEPWPALMYLHANCGNCHRPGALAFDRVDMNLWLTVASLGDPTTTPTYATTIGVVLSESDPGYGLRVVPALPGESGLVHRMQLREGVLQMPPVGSELPDPDGIKLVEGWIGSL